MSLYVVPPPVQRLDVNGVGEVRRCAQPRIKLQYSMSWEDAFPDIVENGDDMSAHILKCSGDQLAIAHNVGLVSVWNWKTRTLLYQITKFFKQ